MTKAAETNNPRWDAALVAGVGPTPVRHSLLGPSDKPRFKSRFFFRPLNQDSIDLHKEQSKAPEVSYVDQSVVAHVAATKKVLPSGLSSNIDRVREFFVQELAPLTLALDPGANQAKEVLKEVVGVEISSEPFYRFENMASRAVLIRMAQFLEQYLELPTGSAEALLSQPRAAQPSPTSTPGDPAQALSDSPARGFKKLERTLQRILDKSEGAANGRPITPAEG